MNERNKLSDRSDVDTLRAAAKDMEIVEGAGIAPAVMSHELRRIADRLQACEAALRASTELLKTTVNPDGFVAIAKIDNQIAANEAVLGGK